MSNSNGSYRTTRELMFKAFDKLPKRVRERLTQANRDWVPQPLRTRQHRDKHARPSDLIAMIDEWDRRDTEKHFRELDRLARKS